MSYEIRNDKLLREAYEAGRRDALNEQVGGGAIGANLSASGQAQAPLQTPGTMPGQEVAAGRVPVRVVPGRLDDGSPKPVKGHSWYYSAARGQWELYKN